MMNVFLFRQVRYIYTDKVGVFIVEVSLLLSLVSLSLTDERSDLSRGESGNIWISIYDKWIIIWCHCLGQSWFNNIIYLRFSTMVRN